MIQGCKQPFAGAGCLVVVRFGQPMPGVRVLQARVYQPGSLCPDDSVPAGVVEIIEEDALLHWIKGFAQCLGF